jgi:hypothetical protein
MTLQEVTALLSEVKRLSEDADDHGAHELEDKLHIQVLNAIANGAENSAELARECLKTLELGFERWYS